MSARLARLAEPPVVARLAVSGFVLVVGIFVAVRLLDIYPWNDRFFDLWAYWSTRYDLDYTGARPGNSGAYLYSPAFAHLIAPLAALPLPVFMAVWTALLAGVLYWLAGWRAFFLGALAPVAMSIAIGQLDLLMAAAIVVGFRWPAAWVLPILSKVTPGIGLLWFAARGEWRSLLTGVGVTLSVVLLSFAIDPRAWLGWVDMLLRFEVPTAAAGVYLPVPVWVRLPLVALLVVWGARTDRRWTLPVAITFSLPTVWLNTPTILIAMLPLLEFGADTPAGRWLRGTQGRPAMALQRVRRRVRRAGLVLRREVAALVASRPVTSRRARGEGEVMGR
jgi:hypothetical protein